jgi:hypothetical protein
VLEPRTPCGTARFGTPVEPTSPSSRGPGHRPFTAVTRVRISVGTPSNLPAFLRFYCSSAFVAPLLPPTGPRCASNRIAWLSDAGDRCM